MLKALSILIIAAILSVLGTSCNNIDSNNVIRVENGQFVKNGKPYYFIGTNFWYGAILASEGEGGDRERLEKELDFLNSIGVKNLRILVGSDGESGIHSKVEPTLQISPGVYNDTIFRGLDYLLVEMSKRDMEAVLYLNNSWEWSGGYSQYLAWSGHGKAPIPNVDGWDAFSKYVEQFQQSDSAKALFNNYVKDVISRTNSITGKPYKKDPTIFSWQIANEPRAFGSKNKEPFAKWIQDVAKLIKSIDPNHMVSTGSEGIMGCEIDAELFETIHSYPEIDYMNLHIWPNNWAWVSRDNMFENIDVAINNTKEYTDKHFEIARKYKKPITLEEFGFPRDNYTFTPGSSTTLRDKYYSYIFDMIKNHAENSDVFAGCNFWAWGGFAEPSKSYSFWAKGDDYTGDPAQEEQGLNSVFVKDNSTIELIKKASTNLK